MAKDKEAKTVVDPLLTTVQELYLLRKSIDEKTEEFKDLQHSVLATLDGTTGITLPAEIGESIKFVAMGGPSLVVTITRQSRDWPGCEISLEVVPKLPE